MHKITIPLEQIPDLKSIVKDYITGNQAVKKFYNFNFEVNSYRKIIQTRSSFAVHRRKILYEVLRRQYQNTPDYPSSNLEKLKLDHTFTITTGHQLNLCTGPLFSIYKILKTLKLASALKNLHPEFNFVPVFWMLTEDHDLEEINHFYLFGKKYTWEQSNTQGLVGRYKTDGLYDLMNGIKDCPAFIKMAYQQETLAEATRTYLNTLFGKYGLVILDSDDEELKNLFRPVAETELDHQASSNLVLETNAEFKSYGYKATINPRPINLFYIHEAQRKRIVEADAHKLTLADKTVIGRQEAFKVMRNFSPNVVLRPLYQETILPNLAYIGGPSEMAYWLQLKRVFDYFKVSYPIVIPRAFGLLISKNLQSKIRSLNLRPTSFVLNRADLKSEFMADRPNQILNFDRSDEILKRFYTDFETQVEDVNPQLLGYYQKQKHQIDQIVKGLKKRLTNAHESKYAQDLAKIDSLKNKLYPNGKPQERSENFLSFYINNPNLIDDLYQLIEPFEQAYYILNL